jgi:hypothetical protein
MNRHSGWNWRAGAPLTAGILLMIASYGVSGQAAPAEGPSNIECLERLEVPEHPPLPRAVHIQGVQTVRVLLSEQSTVQTVESTIQVRTSAVEKIFKDSAEKAIRNSRFSKSCGGKAITLIFHYELRDDDSKSLFAFQPPNHFWIRAGPFYIQPSSGQVK